MGHILAQPSLACWDSQIFSYISSYFGNYKYQQTQSAARTAVCFERPRGRKRTAGTVDWKQYYLDYTIHSRVADSHVGNEQNAQNLDQNMPHIVHLFFTFTIVQKSTYVSTYILLQMTLPNRQPHPNRVIHRYQCGTGTWILGFFDFFVNCIYIQLYYFMIKTLIVIIPSVDKKVAVLSELKGLNR